MTKITVIASWVARLILVLKMKGIKTLETLVKTEQSQRNANKADELGKLRRYKQSWKSARGRLATNRLRCLK